MADIAKTVSVIFTADSAGAEAATSRLQAAFASLEKTSFGGLAKNLQDATEPVYNLTAGALKLEAGMLTAGAAMTLVATKAASDFDTSFRQLTTLFDASAEDIGQFRNAIIEFASTSSQPVENITEALIAAVGQGVKYSESLDLIATAEKLAVATRADLKGTTEVLVATIRSYGLTTEDAGRISDVFFKTIDEGKIEMDELARSLSLVTPLAAASGVSIEEVGAAVATLTASGIPAGAAVEYLRSLLTNMVKPSEQAAEMAESLGIRFDAASLKSKGLAGSLLEIGKAVDGDTGKMSRLVGDVGGLVAALALTGPQADKFAETLEAMGNSAGSTQAAFEKMATSLGIATQTAANAFKILLINIGTPLLDEFGGVAAAIAAIFATLAKSVTEGALGSIVKYVESVVAGLGQVLVTIAQNLPAALERADLSGFTNGVDAVAGAIKELFGGINLTSVDGLTKAIEIAGAAFLGLSRFTAGVIESLKPLFDLLVKAAEGAAGMDSSFAEMLGNIAGTASQLHLISKAVVDLLPAFEGLVGLLLVKQGVGLVGAFTGMTGAVGGLAAILPVLIPLLVAAAAAFTGFQLGSVLLQLRDANIKLAESQQLSAEGSKQTLEVIEKFNQQTGLAVTSLDEIIKLQDEGAYRFDQATQRWVQGTTAIAEGAKDAAPALDAQAEKTLKSAEAMMSAAQSTELLDKSQVKLVDGTKNAVAIIDAATGKIIGYEQAQLRAGSAAGSTAPQIDKATEAAKKNEKEMQKAKEAAQKFEIAMEQIASNERIKLIEAKVKLDVANVEANAKIAVAAFESVNTTITSTGEVLGELFKLFAGDTLTFTELSALREQIEVENRRRDEALQLQRRLIEAQIEQIRAQTAALDKGDAIIKIDGAGLQPHLEAFMFEILRAIQTRVNQQGLDLLLGIPIV